MKKRFDMVCKGITNSIVANVLLHRELADSGHVFLIEKKNNALDSVRAELALYPKQTNKQ